MEALTTPTDKKFMTRTSASNLVFIFWVSQEPLLMDFQERYVTVRSEILQDVMQEIETIGSKCKSKLSES
jgi:hypothetical protein